MALLFMDGFDAGDYAQKWSVAGVYTLSTLTRFGDGRCITATTSQNHSKNITASAQVTVGFALYIANANNSPVGVQLKADAGVTTHLTVIRNGSSGLMEVRRGTTGGTVVATGSTVLGVDTWTYVEVQATVADAGGTVKVRLNGSAVNDIDFTGDTKNAGTSTNIDQITLNNGGISIRFDDVYILNSTGSSNTTFLGDVRIQTLIPNANGTTSQLLGSDGNSTDNYQLVDEQPFSTADYVGSATVGQRDTYGMSNVLSGTSTVFGVQNNMIAAKSDASAGSAKSALRTGGTVFYGATNALSTSYLTYTDMYNTNPNTTIAWTTSDADGLEAGMEVA